VTGIIGIGGYGKVYVCFNKNIGEKIRYAMKPVEKKLICDCRNIQNMHWQKEIFEATPKHPFVV